MPAKRSYVWIHFKSWDEKRAICNHCSKGISFNRGTISNLSRHIKSKHPFIRLKPLQEDNIEQSEIVQQAERDQPTQEDKQQQLEESFFYSLDEQHNMSTTNIKRFEEDTMQEETIQEEPTEYDTMIEPRINISKKTAQLSASRNHQRKPPHLNESSEVYNDPLGDLCMERNQIRRDDATVYADSWATSYRKLTKMQKIFAKKAIEDILILGQLEQLSFNYVRQPVTPSPSTRDAGWTSIH